ncbi:unnamed protein product [Heligmosomoides polygyrus]|uniref:Zinc finger, CCHC-type n=1 Tax=Heligmosomoides polygyrus TaxID=6339 RepID=A0A183GLX2_HELPZ|nr:unnamed protein product [Heligmosomoides polygyrus]
MLNQVVVKLSNADLLNAIKEYQAHVNSTFNHMAARLRSLEGAISELLERSKPKPAGIFCPVEDNRGANGTHKATHDIGNDCGVQCTALEAYTYVRIEAMDKVADSKEDDHKGVAPV